MTFTAKLIRSAQRLPAPLLRLAAGRPERVDGQTLDPLLQVGLRLYHLARRPPLHTLDPTAARRETARTLQTFDGPPQPMAAVTELRLALPGRTLAARLYRPLPMAVGACTPAVVYFHGGGHVVGDLDTHDGPCRFLAHASRLPVLSVDYRLAPEHPFPAPFDDALDAFRWVRDHGAELGLDGTRLAVAGDSAGGNLAAALCVAVAAAGEPGPALQVLFYALTDARAVLPARTVFAHGYGLDDADITWFRDHYLGATDRADPRVSVLLAKDVTGVAPAYIASAGFDPLRDDGAAYAERLATAGVPVRYVCHSALIHGFVSFCGVHRPSAEALRDAAAAIKAGLAVD